VHFASSLTFTFGFSTFSNYRGIAEKYSKYMNR
jgi:hypothetical protein